MNHIVYIADENYVIPTQVSLNSLCKNASKEITAHILGVELSDKSREKLKSIKSEFVTVQVLEIENTFEKYDFSHAYVSKVALLKFRLPEIFKEFDKILYIDGDIILNKGFEKIFEFDISNYYAAVVQDMLAVVRDKWTEKLGREKYFNSGVMYLNLARMRQDECTKKLIDCKLNEKLHKFMDQDTLNCILGENVLWIDCRFNFLVEYYPDVFSMEQIALFYSLNNDIQEQCKKQPYFLHFAGNKKAWKDVITPHFEEWIAFADDSLFLTLIKNYCAESEKRIDMLISTTKELNSRLDYLQHRTLFGATKWLLQKIFYARGIK